MWPRSPISILYRAMALHLTPTELGRVGLHRREVIHRCMQLGIPIFQSRIDKTLFLELVAAEEQRRASELEADHFSLLDGEGNLIESFEDSTSARAMLQDILKEEPEAEGHVLLIAYDASGHPIGQLRRNPSAAPA